MDLKLVHQDYFPLAFACLRTLDSIYSISDSIFATYSILSMLELGA